VTYCNMELEALQQIYGEVRGLGAQIVVLTPELERYTRALHKKLNLTFDILTDLHLKTAEEFRLVFTLTDYLREHDTWSTSRGLSELPMWMWTTRSVLNLPRLSRSCGI